MSDKTQSGNFFEDFRVGQTIAHATPRTISDGDVAMYGALFGARFALNSAKTFADSLTLAQPPIDSLLVFHVVFGQTTPDISLNAIANLGYANGRFGAIVYAGDTLSTSSIITGLKANRDGRTGVVFVHSRGVNQRGEMVVEYDRWVMVRKRDDDAPPPDMVVPKLPNSVAANDLNVPYSAKPSYDTSESGSRDLWDDYHNGEKIDHVDAMTIEESEHMMACRLFHNIARVHFNKHVERNGRFGRRIVYGGHVISMARALSFNGLANAQTIAAINGGRHTAPAFAGDTIYAWTEVLETMELTTNSTIGALRLRTVATKDRACDDFPLRSADGKYLPEVVLDFDYTVLMPRRV